jgi:hypothetical protein
VTPPAANGSEFGFSKFQEEERLSGIDDLLLEPARIRLDFAV